MASFIFKNFDNGVALDISVLDQPERSRTYFYRNGYTVTAEDTECFCVSSTGGHWLWDSSNQRRYINSGWTNLTIDTKEK